MASTTLPFSSAEIFSAEGRTHLEQRVLPGYFREARWFGGKARDPRSFQIVESVPIDGAGPTPSHLALIRVVYPEGPAEIYSLPLEVSQAAEAEGLLVNSPSAIIATFADGSVLFDAMHGERFRASLLHMLATEGRAAGDRGEISGVRGSVMPADAVDGLASRVLKVEQSNSSIIYTEPGGEAGPAGVLFVKLFRKLEDGMNPDVEITRFLAERRGFLHVPPFGGAVEYRRPGHEVQVLALALGLIANEGDAWSYALHEVRRFYERVLEAGAGGETPEAGDLFDGSGPSEELHRFIGEFYGRVQQLGQRTGEMHMALASDDEDPAFAPEPLTPADQQALGTALEESIQQTLTMLQDRTGLKTGHAELVEKLLQSREDLLGRARGVSAQTVTSQKTRTHGDYHLGQVLNTGKDFVIIDFEGEPQRSLVERKEKRSPLRDVAGMLRSFHYAAHSGLEDFPEERTQLEPWAEAWTQACSRAYLQAWLKATQGAAFVPASEADLRTLLNAFLLEKAVYEVGYELNNRPAWLAIPVRGILRILGAGSARSSSTAGLQS